MRSPVLSLRHILRLSLLLVAVFGVASIGLTARQNTGKGLRCGSDTKLDAVLNHPDEYFGKTVTLEGEMHRTFSDKVFSIEDDDFLRDDDLLIITDASKSEVVKAVKDSIEAGKDVCVTGVIQPFNRSEMESKFGPLNIDSRASHYPEGSPVMIIEKLETATTLERVKPSLPPAASPETEPMPTELETKSEDRVSPEPSPEPSAEPSPEPSPEGALPETGGPLPLIVLGGMLSLLGAAGIRLRQR